MDKDFDFNSVKKTKIKEKDTFSKEISSEIISLLEEYICISGKSIFLNDELNLEFIVPKLGTSARIFLANQNDLHILKHITEEDFRKMKDLFKLITIKSTISISVNEYKTALELADLIGFLSCFKSIKKIDILMNYHPSVNATLEDFFKRNIKNCSDLRFLFSTFS